MMSIQEVSAEQFAKLFHHYYEALAPDFNCADECHGEAWPEVPPNREKPNGCGRPSSVAGSALRQ